MKQLVEGIPKGGGDSTSTAGGKTSASPANAPAAGAAAAAVIVPHPAAAGGQSRPHLAFLDGLRGLAAFYVMMGHARSLLWEGYSTGYLIHPQRYSAPEKLFVFGAALAKWGHEAVIFFFVLSGFVIHLKGARRIVALGPQARLEFWPYLYRRARRLYPPLILALLLTWGLDSWGQHLQLPIYQGTHAYSALRDIVGSDHRAVTALRNLFFIMQPVFGSDGPLWSLNYEWFFYLLYPAIFLLARVSLGRATAVVVALSLLSFLPGWPNSLGWCQGVLRLMIVWWFGALLAERFAGRFKLRYSTLSPLMVALLIVPLSPSGLLRDIIIGLGFTGLIAACLALQSRRPWLLAPLARLRPLGEMSYTLYVIHFPMLVFLSGLLMRARGGLLPQHFGWVAIGIGTCTAVAWALHLLVERPFTTGGG